MAAIDTSAITSALQALDAALGEAFAQIGEGGATTPPNPEPPNPEPPTGGGGGTGDFKWEGVNTKFPKAGPRVARTAFSGSTTFTSPSKVSAKKFTKAIIVKCDGMEFEDCEWDVPGADWVIDADSQKIKVTYSIIKGGGGPAALIGVADVWYCDVSGTQDGLKIQGSNVAVRGNFIHDLGGPAEAHNDGMQLSGTNSNITIEQNTIRSKDTSCIFIKPEVWSGQTMQINNIVVQNNDLQNGGFRVYFDNANNGGMTGCKLKDNILRKSGYGYYSVNKCTVDISGNVNEKGQPITGYQTP